MFKDRFGALTNRRALFRRGAMVSGAAAAGVGLAPYRALAADSVDDSLLKRVLDRGKVIVGTGATNPPWHFEDDNGKAIGMDIDMAKLLAAGLFGLQVVDKQAMLQDDSPILPHIEFVIQDPNARIPNLLTDKVDINFQFMTVKTDRATQCEFTIPYYREAWTLLMPKDGPYNNVADLEAHGVTISVLQNDGDEQDTLKVVPDATVVQLATIADAIAAVDAGRADAAGVDLSSGKWFAANAPDKYKFTPESFNPNTYAASVKQGDQIWLNFVNTMIHEALIGLDFPVYQQMFKKWFGEDLPSPISGFPAEYK